MKKKIITFTIFAAVFLFVGIIIWNKSKHKSTDEILQEKAEQFYENQESFEKIVAYASGFDVRSITENNKMRADVVIDGITFRLKEKESEYVLSHYPAKTLLSQLMDSDENEPVVNVIGERSSMSICYDKKSYSNIMVVFSIEDSRMENVMAKLIWHNSDYEPKGDLIYSLNDNWTIAAMGMGPCVKGIWFLDIIGK